MLRDSSADQPILEFQEKDIPSPNRDAHTHRVLTDMLNLRNQMDEDFNLTPDSAAKDGSAMTNPHEYEAAYLQRDREYHRLNRSMYHVYAASAHLIHDNNFLSYCRLSLRNLPVATAYKLATLKDSLRPTADDTAPYQTIQRPTMANTQPVFSAPRPSFADVVRPPLQRRQTWMKEQPPYMNEEEADRVWHQSNEALFGVRSPATTELQQQIQQLQQILDERPPTSNPTISEDKDARTVREMAAWR
jgi:hypothetical protein